MSSQPPPTTSWRLLRRSAVAGLALVILYFGTAFALSRFLDPEALAAWLEPRLEEAFNRDVDVGLAEVGFLPLGIRLKEVTLADPTGLAPHLATVGSMDFRVEMLPLLRKEIRVSRLTIEAPRADLHVGADGRSNFGDFSAQGAREEHREDRPPFTLNLRSIQVMEGQIRYNKVGESVVAELGSFTVQAAARQNPESGWFLAGSSSGDLTVRRGEDPPLFEEAPLVFSFDLEADGDLGSLGIRAGELGLGPLVLGLSGKIAHLQDPVRAVELDLSGERIPLTDLLAALPDSIRVRLPGEAQGSLGVRLRVEGDIGPGQRPTISGQATLTEGRLVREGVRLAEGLSADFILGTDGSVQTRAEASVLGGPFSLEGTVSTKEGMDLNLRATPDLEDAETVFEFPEGVSTRGTVATQIRIVGPAGDLHDLRFRGNLRPMGVRGTHPSLGVPVEFVEGELRLDGVRAFFEDVPILLGDDRLAVSGEIPDIFALLDAGSTPQFNGSVGGPRLDLQRLNARPLPDSTLTYGKVAFAKVGGRPVGGRSFQDAARELGLTRPASLPLAGSLAVSLDTVIDRQGRMEHVNARIDFGPSFVRVSDAGFNRYGGEVRAAANLTLSPDDAAPFSFRLQVQGLDAGVFLSQTTSLGRFARGKLSAELDIIGTLDGLLLPDRPALVGSGRFSLTGGGLASGPLTQGLADFLGMDNLREPSVQDWETSFVMEEGRVRLADALVQGAPGTPRVGGSVGLDGGLDIQSVFSLPSERLNPAALERLGVAGEIAANVARRPEVIQAILRIGGSVFDPSIHADPQATTQTLGAAVQEEVTREAQQRIDAQRTQLQERATGFLRSLLRRPDTERIPPLPDSAPSQLPVDSVRPDTLAPDTLLPDTLRPDTLGPDTVPPDTLRPDTLGPDIVAESQSIRKP